MGSQVASFRSTPQPIGMHGQQFGGRLGMHCLRESPCEVHWPKAIELIPPPPKPPEVSQSAEWGAAAVMGRQADPTDVGAE